MLSYLDIRTYESTHLIIQTLSLHLLLNSHAVLAGGAILHLALLLLHHHHGMVKIRKDVGGGDRATTKLNFHMIINFNFPV